MAIDTCYKAIVVVFNKKKGDVRTSLIRERTIWREERERLTAIPFFSLPILSHLFLYTGINPKQTWLNGVNLNLFYFIYKAKQSRMSRELSPQDLVVQLELYLVSSSFCVLWLLVSSSGDGIRSLNYEGRGNNSHILDMECCYQIWCFLTKYGIF